MKFKNVSPLGDLDIPGVGIVPAGHTFEASGDLAESFLKQPENYTRTDKPKSRSTEADDDSADTEEK